MGKKSKRSRSSSNRGGTSTGAALSSASHRKDECDDDLEETKKRNVSSAPPSARRRNEVEEKDDEKEEEEEETMDNLRFEDPYGDSFEEEEEESVDDDEEEEEYEPMNDDDDDDDAKPNFNDDREEERQVRSWNPFSRTLGSDERLEMDESAYKMHHALTAEWPSLSFAFVRDELGENRTRFPHSLIAVAGTQADKSEKNKLNVMRMSDLGRTEGKKGEKEMDDEMLGEEYDGGGGDDDDDDDSESESDSEDEELADLDPILEHYSLRHRGGVNRVKICPHRPDVVACWSDEGKVNLYDIGGVLDVFERSSGGGTRTRGATADRKIRKDPFFVYGGHDTEGYALDWSKVNPGTLATGDCHGNVHVWTPESTKDFASDPAVASRWNNSSFHVVPAYAPTGPNLDNPSVEDIQWSPTEGTVFATAECGGCVKIYDVRSKIGPMIVQKIHSNGSDVNVLSWNASVSNLLATGGDDGTFAVWDLRTFQTKADENKPEPLARFANHRTPITGMEWHPTDESMIAVSDENGAYVYDLSVEEDEEEDRNAAGGGEDDEEGGVPPQLLFAHCGSAASTKEVHWHPQITSCLMTTSLSGFSVFIPSNL